MTVGENIDDIACQDGRNRAMVRPMKSFVVVLVIVFAVGCKSSDKPESSSTARGSAAPSAAALAVAPGAGDKSGTSISNAMAVEPGKTATGLFPCGGSLVMGPFSFTQEPTKVRLNVTAKNTSTNQACLGGSWVDGKGKFISVAGIGCLDPGTSHEATVEIEYSPNSGGINANPMYLDLRYGQATPPNCKPLPLEIRLP